MVATRRQINCNTLMADCGSFRDRHVPLSPLNMISGEHCSPTKFENTTNAVHGHVDAGGVDNVVVVTALMVQADVFHGGLVHIF